VGGGPGTVSEHGHNSLNNIMLLRGHVIRYNNPFGLAPSVIPLKPAVSRARHRLLR
jgi:hypothetical protein